MSAALDAFPPHDDDDHHHNKDESHTPADRFQPIYVHDCENTPDRIVANSSARLETGQVGRILVAVQTRLLVQTLDLDLWFHAGEWSSLFLPFVWTNGKPTSGSGSHADGTLTSHWYRNRSELHNTGAPGRIRTCGLLLRRQTLYPLSYGGARIKPVRRWAPTA
jgi:hypothetical protein